MRNKEKFVEGFDITKRPFDYTKNPFVESHSYHKSWNEKDCKVCKSNLIWGYGPSHGGSSVCRMQTSIASGGKRSHCTCAACF